MNSIKYNPNNTKVEPILLLDGHHGVYIPQIFAGFELLGNVKTPLTQEEKNDLKSPDNELYWDTWYNLLTNFEITIDGVDYYLYQDDDLWLMPVGYDFDDFKN